MSGLIGFLSGFKRKLIAISVLMATILAVAKAGLENELTKMIQGDRTKMCPALAVVDLQHDASVRRASVCAKEGDI